MRLAHDLYAETNPAFCTYALAEFVKAYLSIDEAGPELPTAYLGLPLALSEDLAAAFDGTNKKTGLLEWLARTPQMSVGLADRVNASLDIVTDGLRFGCFLRVLTLSPGGRLGLGAQKAKPGPLGKIDDLSTGVVRRAGRLGAWFAMAGTTRNIFGTLGLTV
jgi:hypothetical protein